MSFSTLIFGLLALANFSIAGYVLQDNYTPNNFFSMFDFFTAPDPTHGFVKYVDQATAQRTGLIKTAAGSVYMGVDSTNVTPGGRPSVRITSKKSYNTGLIILDLAHMPASICGTWPAFWTVGPNWPHSGEIDIIEGVNEQQSNSMALHTGPGCGISNNGAFTGSIVHPSCDVWAGNQPANSGCSIHSSNTQTYGNGFNAVGGGVYVTEWTNKYISIFHFPRNRIPADITQGRGCNFEASFKNQQIVFDTTFCGDWAGNVWAGSSCASKAPTCNAFVQNNPSAFRDSFWTVNSLKVYSNTGVFEAPDNTTVPEESSAVSTYPAVSTTFATQTSAPAEKTTTAEKSSAIETSLPAESTFFAEPTSSAEASAPAETSIPAEPTTVAPSVTSAPASTAAPTSPNPTSTTSPPWGYYPGRRNRRPNRRHLMEHRRAHGVGDLS
ncbi:hypothetical protein H2199_001288 [Coniosporium tulheliwenetii]|uniref:Uncharacterized protein n=1 Tax=Coniosporium tulheliwenetii TaxID=3383036 RepID=A0ACC2ZLF6_9PEZI|nr:hypothetical protein H2199_001288 [Cladosporium sp. JES 115]